MQRQGPVERHQALEHVPGPFLFLGVGISYFAVSQYVIWLNDPVNLGAGFWPAAGITLAAMLMSPTRRWAWILAAIFVAEFSGDMLHGYPVGGITLWALGNMVEPLVGAALIRRFLPGTPTLAPLRRLVGFVALGAVAGPLVGASVGSLGTFIFYDMAAVDVWPKYFIGDGLGVLVMAPIILSWLSRPTMRSMTEKFAILLSAAAVTTLVFRNWDAYWDVTLPYLIIPLLTWAGLRGGVRGAAVISFVVAHIANASTAFGYGPFALAGSETHAVTLLQLFIAITIVSTLALAAVTEDLMDRKVVERRLAAHNRELQAALDEISASHLYIRKLEGILPICMNCKAVRSDDDTDWLPIDTYLMRRSDAVSLSHTLCPDCVDSGAMIL